MQNANSRIITQLAALTINFQSVECIAEVLLTRCVPIYKTMFYSNNRIIGK